MKDKSLKVCLIAPIPPPYGGIGNWVLMIKKYVQNRDDVKLSIISTAPKSRGIDGRKLWERVFIQGFNMIKKLVELRKLIHTNRPDVIHITTSGQLSIIRDIMMLRLAKKKAVTSIYHIRFGRIKEIADGDTVEWKLISKAMRYATTIMAIDRTTYEVICKYIPISKVVYVPNPIDPSNLPKYVKKNNKKRTVLFLGWVVETKGVEELLTAWSKIYNKFNDWELNIVGPCKSAYYSHLMENYCLKGVKFSGEQNHKNAMVTLSSSSIFVLPSYTEGFPNVLLEAMVYSKPIIATNVGAIPEILANNCGIVIPSKDTDSLEKALVLLMDDFVLRETLGKTGNTKVYEQYVIDKVFKQYEQIWMSRSIV